MNKLLFVSCSALTFTLYIQAKIPYCCYVVCDSNCGRMLKIKLIYTLQAVDKSELKVCDTW
jgi:hypothetical protein